MPNLGALKKFNALRHVPKYRCSFSSYKRGIHPPPPPLFLGGRYFECIRGRDSPLSGLCGCKTLRCARQGDRVISVANAKFFVHGTDMPAHGFATDKQQLRNLSVMVPGGNQIQDLFLAFGQSSGLIGRRSSCTNADMVPRLAHNSPPASARRTRRYTAAALYAG